MSEHLPTPEEIELLTLSNLVKKYNALAFAVGAKQVTKFTDRATGIKRLTAVAALAAEKAAEKAPHNAEEKAVITWLTITLWLNVYAVVFGVRRHCADADDAGCMGCIMAVAGATVPAIYAVGWLLLPAYGVGAP